MESFFSCSPQVALEDNATAKRVTQVFRDRAGSGFFGS